jgi:hypothetical protein
VSSKSRACGSTCHVREFMLAQSAARRPNRVAATTHDAIFQAVRNSGTRATTGKRRHAAADRPAIVWRFWRYR